MSPALRCDGKGHLSRRITLMVLPFEHMSEPDATGNSSSEIDSNLHSEICLEPDLLRLGSTPAAERPHGSPSNKKSSSCS
jgi:hypothetical protein